MSLPSFQAGRWYLASSLMGVNFCPSGAANSPPKLIVIDHQIFNRFELKAPQDHGPLLGGDEFDIELDIRHCSDFILSRKTPSGSLPASNSPRLIELKTYQQLSRVFRSIESTSFCLGILGNDYPGSMLLIERKELSVLSSRTNFQRRPAAQHTARHSP